MLSRIPQPEGATALQRWMILEATAALVKSQSSTCMKIFHFHGRPKPRIAVPPGMLWANVRLTQKSTRLWSVVCNNSPTACLLVRYHWNTTTFARSFEHRVPAESHGLRPSGSESPLTRLLTEHPWQCSSITPYRRGSWNEKRSFRV